MTTDPEGEGGMRSRSKADEEETPPFMMSVLGIWVSDRHLYVPE